MPALAKARPRAARPDRAPGFTLLELIVVIVILGALSITFFPRVHDAAMFRQAAYRDEVVAALRYAQKTAVSHRRLVCASFAPGVAQAATVTLTIAAAHDDASCSASTLNAPDGSTAFARSADTANVTASVSGTTDGKIYFQPSGLITASGGAGAAAQNFSITVSGMSAIALVGSTGLIYAD